MRPQHIHSPLRTVTSAAFHTLYQVYIIANLKFFALLVLGVLTCHVGSVPSHDVACGSRSRCDKRPSLRGFVGDFHNNICWRIDAGSIYNLSSRTESTDLCVVVSCGTDPRGRTLCTRSCHFSREAFAESSCVGGKIARWVRNGDCRNDGMYLLRTFLGVLSLVRLRGYKTQGKLGSLPLEYLQYWRSSRAFCCS